MTIVGAEARANPGKRVARRTLWLDIGALVLLGLLVIVALSVGRYPMTPGDVLAVIWMKLTGAAASVPTSAETVLFQVRAPRIVAAAVIGAALAAAGAAYQGMFRNPLVSPDILGVSAGAGLGAVLAIFLSLSVVAIQGFAFAGGLLAVAAVYFVGSSVRGHDPILALILAGVVIGTLLGACIALLKYLADPYNQLPAITFWLLGSVASVGPQDLKVMLPLVLVALVPLFLLRWRMNLLSLADDEARALGVQTGIMRVVIVCAATLMTAASVAVSGIIGWVGLLIPHAARMLVGPEFSRLLPVSMLLGASYLLGVDTLARTMARIEIPPGVLTAVIGTPFFVWLLAVSRRSW
ncbi:MAG: iron ABC transporter permease [Burkholderiales bacterium]